jgi:hypothetical protein
VNPLERNLVAAFYFSGGEKEEMAGLVDHGIDIFQCLNADIQTANKPSRIPIFGRLQKEHDQWFYILNSDGRLPRSADLTDYPDIKESSIRLPANRDGLVKIEHALKALANQCSIVDIRLTPRVIVEKPTKKNPNGVIEEGVILFRIKTHSEPHRR